MVGAAAEESAGHGADAVTQQGAGQAGVDQQVVADDGGDVLVVGDVLGKDDEGDRDVGDRDGTDVATVQLFQTVDGLEEDEILRDQLVVDKGFERHAVFPENAELGEVEHLECVDAGGVADGGEDRRDGVACEDAENEGDQANHLLAVGGAEHGHEESDKTAQDGDERGGESCAGGVRYAAGHEVGNGVSGQRKADDGNCRPNDHNRHELLQPANTGEFNDQSDHDIDKTGKYRAEDQADIAK